ncbi:50S ribosomal protein L15 [Nitrospinota bacterium]
MCGSGGDLALAPENDFTRLGDLRATPGSVRERTRVGRGTGSGIGKTSRRGQKGQKSRSGYSRRPGFEGGQMPLQRRLPKRGFKNIFQKKFSEVNVGRLARFDSGVEVDALTLQASGVVRKLARNGVKLLGSGAIDRPLSLKVQGCSESARKKIEAAGGSVEIVPFKAEKKDTSA